MEMPRNGVRMIWSRFRLYVCYSSPQYFHWLVVGGSAVALVRKVIYLCTTRLCTKTGQKTFLSIAYIVF